MINANLEHIKILRGNSNVINALKVLIAQSKDQVIAINANLEHIKINLGKVSVFNVLFTNIKIYLVKLLV